MFISTETEENINLLIQAMFNHNRTIDRMLSFSDTQWAFVNFSKNFHSPYAHLFPILADKLTDILGRYNLAAKYYETHKDERTYNSILDMFQTNLEEHENTYKLLVNTIIIANKNNEYNVESDLKEFMKLWNKFMAQAILLRDKAQIYEEDKACFDGFSDQFYILKDEYNQLINN